MTKDYATQEFLTNNSLNFEPKTPAPEEYKFWCPPFVQVTVLLGGWGILALVLHVTNFLGWVK